MTMIKITCGSKNDRFGRTTFLLLEDGTVQVTNEHVGERYEYQERVNPVPWQQLGKNLQPHQGMDAIAMRKGTAHEAVYEIQVGGDKEQMNMSIWHNDLKKYPAIEVLIQAARESVRKFSNGKVQL